MENLNEKGKVAAKKANGIREERLKILQGNYQKPTTSDFQIDEKFSKECSDMASQLYFPGMGACH